MKMKGINPVELHADKIALGVVAVAGLAAVSLQFIHGGSTIKVGTKDGVPLATAFGPVEEAARGLQAKVNAETVTPPDAPAFTLSNKLAIGADAPSISGPRVALGPAPQIKQGDLGAVIAAAAYALPAVPAPSGATAIPYSAAIHPAEKILHPELAAILPEAQPYDKPIVSVEFTFDGTALRAALEHDPEGAAEALPVTWWRAADAFGADLITVVAVEVERELITAPDGVTPTGPKTEIIASMPGRPNGLKTWQDNVRSIGDVPVMVDSLRTIASDIERPEFYSIIEGPKWEPPTEFMAKGDPAERRKQVDAGRVQERKVRIRIGTLEQQLAAAPQEAPGGRENPRSAPPPPPPGGGGGKGGPGTGPNTPAPRTTAPGGNRRTIERNLNQAKGELATIAKKLMALGETVEGFEPEAVAAAESGGNVNANLLDNPGVTLWAHDLTGLPGATYRYRARVVLNNPLFDRNLQEGEQKELGKDSLLRGAWSEWSSAVTVDPMNAFFVTSASERSTIQPMPTASAEVYQFYYGYYRVAKVTLEPGDSVADPAKLPELRVADLAKLGETVKKGMPGGPITTAPAVAPGRGTPGPGRGTPGPGQVPTPTPAPTTQPVPGTEGGLIQWPDWMTEELPKSLPLSVNAVFLDVQSVPTEGGQTRTQAVLRLGNGVLAIKAPDAESKTSLYRRLDGSARIGLNQGRDVSKPLDFKLPPPPGRRQDGDGGRRPGGGAGGG